jgi:hypothetical protein
VQVGRQVLARLARTSTSGRTAGGNLELLERQVGSPHDGARVGPFPPTQTFHSTHHESSVERKPHPGTEVSSGRHVLAAPPPAGSRGLVSSTLAAAEWSRGGGAVVVAAAGTALGRRAHAERPRQRHVRPPLHLAAHHGRAGAGGARTHPNRLPVPPP